MTPVRKNAAEIALNGVNGPSGETRTPGFHIPNVAPYQLGYTRSGCPAEKRSPEQCPHYTPIVPEWQELSSPGSLFLVRCVNSRIFLRAVSPVSPAPVCSF